MLIGASSFIQQLYQAFFLINCTNLSELVRTGKLDFLLLLPVNTRFVVSLRQVDLGAFVNATFALATMAYALHMAHVTGEISALPNLLQIFGFFVLCIVGIVIHYSLMFLLASISFWTVRAQGIVWGYYNLFNIARMPDEAFRGAFKAIFTFAIPMLLVSNVPARVLVKPATSLKWSLLLLGMSVLCFAVSEWGWRASLRRYTCSVCGEMHSVGHPAPARKPTRPCFVIVAWERKRLSVLLGKFFVTLLRGWSGIFKRGSLLGFGGFSGIRAPPTDGNVGTAGF